MSVLKSHKRMGQAAIFIGVVLLAIVAAVFWNWDLIQSNMQPVNFSSLLESPSLQIVLVVAVMIVALFVYMIYKAKEPMSMRGG